MPPDVIARLHVGAVPLAISVLVLGIAAATILMYSLAPRRRHALLWFGVFSLLYGGRMLLLNPFAQYVLAVPRSVIAWSDSMITYTVGIPGFLLARLVAPASWARLLTWMFRAQLVFAAVAISSDILLRKAMSMGDANRVIAIAFTAVVVVRIVRERQPAFRGSRVFWTSLALFYAAVLDHNFGNLLAGVDLEPVGFFLVLCSVAYVLGARMLHQESQFKAMQHELATAQRIQMSILPDRAPELPGLAIAMRYSPMTQVAGDLYDFLPAGEGRTGVLVADVSGHGVPAALVASMLKVALSAQRHHADDPAAVLAGINESLAPHLRGQFVTAAYVVVDPREPSLSYSGAGHPPVLVRHADGTVDAFENNGIIIGPFPAAAYTNLTVPLAPGDRVIMYTDGITEAEHEGIPFEQAEMHAAIASLGGDVEAFATGLLDRVERWSGPGASDDRTLVVLDLAMRYSAVR